MKMKRTIRWKPFSPKHKEYIRNALHNKMNVAEGAIRSGKTIDHCIIAAMYLETCPDKIHLASGSTIGNAKLNIGVCNGYGLENLFSGRCKWGRYKDNEALFVYTQTGEKVIIFAGGAKADSYKRILGNSYGLWIATEINEHYDCEDSRSSFIKVAFGRQVAAEKPLVLWDLNPCNPGHSVYSSYIDRYKEGYVGGYQYQHFTIKDNYSITDQRRAEIESQYAIGSKWYRRDILGERCIAEGLVYPMWEEALENPPTGKAEKYVLSIDYGTLNAFAAILWGKFGDTWYQLREYYYSGRDKGVQKTDEEYANDLDAFLESYVPDGCKQNESEVKFLDKGRKLLTIIDPSAASFIATLRKRKYYKVVQAKNAVEDGIRDTASAMHKGMLKLNPECENTVSEIQNYIWDTSATEDRPVKENDHAMDAMRYMVFTAGVVRFKHRSMPIVEVR